MSVSIILLIIVIPLLVLFIRLSIKRPGLAAIIALVPIILFVLFYFTASNMEVVSQEAQPATLPNLNSNVQSPIWSEGIENEFEADVYPSGISALRALAPRIVRNIPYVMGESGSPKTIVIYSNSLLVIEITEEFRQTISKLMPEIKCRIEISNTVGIEPKEVGIHFNLTNSRKGKVNDEHLLYNGESGTIQARLHSHDRTLDIQTHFTNKFWVENFASFQNSQTNKYYIVAKSNETSISPEDADWQAMNQAAMQVGSRVAISGISIQNFQNKDILESGIVVDKFVQSFDGSSGKIWREAILLDVSPDKLNHLAAIASGVSRARLSSWARMAGSIIGLFILITIAYAFLNAATRGYYSLTLKIVGIILAAIFLFFILHFAGFWAW